MKKRTILLTISIICLFPAGCASNPTQATIQATAPASPHIEHHSEHSNQASPESSNPDNAGKYSLDAVVNKENDNYYLKTTTNLKLSSEHYGYPPEEGEGHIHLYLNGALVGPIKDTTPYLLPSLQKGTNTIKLVLAENNHSERFKVSKELSIEKPE